MHQSLVDPSAIILSPIAAVISALQLACVVCDILQNLLRKDNFKIIIINLKKSVAVVILNICLSRGLVFERFQF